MEEAHIATNTRVLHVTSCRTLLSIEKLRNLDRKSRQSQGISRKHQNIFRESAGWLTVDLENEKVPPLQKVKNDIMH